MWNILQDIFIGALLAAIGVVLLGFCYPKIEAWWAIRSDPVVTTGIVYDMENDAAYGWRPYVHFQDSNGREFRFHAWSYYRPPFEPDKGEKVPVRYARTDPGFATIDTVWGTYASFVYFGVIGLFALFGGLWAMTRWIYSEPVSGGFKRDKGFERWDD